MSNILEEIKQEVEQERWMALWKKYQNHVYSAIAGILVLSAGIMWWQNNETAKISAQSNDYTQALMMVESDPNRAFKIFENIPSKGETIYATLARFWVASILLERGDQKGAKDLYEIIYKNSSGLFTSGKKKALGQLAHLKSLYIDIDTVDPEVIIQKAKPYAEKNSAWKGLAHELLGLAHLKKGNKTEALAHLTQITSDTTTPAPVKIRAQAIINYLHTHQS
ncbi:MAG: tetratricopeptide repeat protein [Alphaproteobacteria bacterium]